MNDTYFIRWLAGWLALKSANCCNTLKMLMLCYTICND